MSARGSQHEGSGPEGTTASDPDRALRRRFRLLAGGLLALTLAINVAPVAASHLNVKTSDINDGAVTTPKLRDNAVKQAKIDDGAVRTSKIQDGAVTSPKLKGGAVNAGKLAPGVRPRTSGWIGLGSHTTETSDGTNVRAATVPAPEITQDVIDNGIVLVYLRSATYFGDGRSVALPYTNYAGGHPSTIDFYVKPGEITITRFMHNNIADFATVREIRYVIIPKAQALPGGAAAADVTGQAVSDPADEHVPSPSDD